MRDWFRGGMAGFVCGACKNNNLPLLEHRSCCRWVAVKISCDPGPQKSVGVYCVLCEGEPETQI